MSSLSHSRGLVQLLTIAALSLTSACGDDEAPAEGSGESGDASEASGGSTGTGMSGTSSTGTGVDGASSTGTTSDLGTTGGSGDSGSSGTTTGVGSTTGSDGSAGTGSGVETSGDATSETSTETGGEGEEETDAEASSSEESESGDVNLPPVAEAAQFVVTQNADSLIAFPAHDPDGDELTLEIVEGPSHGQLEQLRDGVSLRYIPNTDYIGEDSFSYRVSDGEFDSEVATISITVEAAPVNQPPTAVDFDVYVDSGETIDIRLRGSDPEGEPLGYRVFGRPRVGELTGDAPDFRYKNTGSGRGTAHMTYQVSDGKLYSETATITIHLEIPDSNGEDGGDDGGDIPTVSVVHVVPAVPAPTTRRRVEDGESWATAFTSFERALERGRELAGFGHIVEFWLAEGTYFPELQDDPPVGDDPTRYCFFDIDPGFSVYGGFKVGATSRSEAVPENNLTVLYGAKGLGAADPECYHTVKIDGGNVARRGGLSERTTIDGVYIFGGLADGDTFELDLGFATESGGGALIINGADAVFNRVSIGANGAIWGGGIALYDSKISLKNSIVLGNVASHPVTKMGDSAGGGMYLVDAFESVIESSNIVGNRTKGWGGGIDVYGGEFLTVKDSEISGNRASIDGGGLSIYESDSEVHGCRFLGNRVEDDVDESGGGAISNYHGFMQLTSSLFFYNHAGNDGGAVHNYEAGIEINSCGFARNYAADDGGAVSNSYAGMIIEKSTISRNEAKENGGGLENDEAELTLFDSTIDHNRADDKGGGIYAREYADSHVANSLFYYNDAEQGGGISNRSDSNLVVSTSSFARNTSDAPILDPMDGSFTGEGGGGGLFSSSTTTLTVESSAFYANDVDQLLYEGVPGIGPTVCSPADDSPVGPNPFIESDPNDSAFVQLDSLAGPPNPCVDYGSLTGVEAAHDDRTMVLGPFLPDFSQLSATDDGELDRNAATEPGLDAAMHYAARPTRVYDVRIEGTAPDLQIKFTVEHASHCMVASLLIDETTGSLVGSTVEEFSYFEVSGTRTEVEHGFAAMAVLSPGIKRTAEVVCIDSTSASGRRPASASGS